MNKEVIYLEPEDDITDILTKLQQAEQKIVALVPPKKATLLRSAVNMKLVARVAKECEKVVVIVSVDPAVVKMAMAARVPVAKNLQSRPVIPAEAKRPLGGAESASEVAPKEKAADIEFDDTEPENASAEPTEAKSEDTETISEEAEDETDVKDKKKAQKAAKKSEKKALGKVKKWLMIGVPTAIVLAVALVWAFVFAPAATITVAISSTPSNISENVTFTTDPEAAKPEEGLFLAELTTLEQKYNAEFTVDKEVDNGEHASGTVTVSMSFYPREYAYTDNGFMITVPDGAVFTTSKGAEYRAAKGTSIFWDGNYPISCDNGSVTKPSGYCVMTEKLEVEALEPGSEYNLLTQVSWENYQGLSVTNSQITGGTTKMVKVVTQEVLDKIAENQIKEHSDEAQKMLLEDVKSAKSELVPIEGSFKAEVAEITSKPAVDEEVDEDAKPSATVVVKYTMYAVTKSQIETFVKAKQHLAEDQRLYSVGEPYFERFTALEEPARMKTTIETGPIVTEDLVFDKAAGRKTGEVQSLLRSINGVSSVKIETSFFWVWSIPEERDRVTIQIEAEDNK